jgi:predicted HTH transcriptional regulator
MPTLRPPGPLVAYLPQADAERLAEHLVAFANADGGTVVVGLDERGRPLGRVYA